MKSCIKIIFSISPVSLEYIIGGGKLLSLKCRCRGYLVLVNKCKTIQMRPANTAMPVETPSNVGRSEVSVDRSESALNVLYFVDFRNLSQISLTLCAEHSFGWLQIANRMKSMYTLTQCIMSNLNTQRINIVIHTSLIIKTLFTQFFRCKQEDGGNFVYELKKPKYINYN